MPPAAGSLFCNLPLGSQPDLRYNPHPTQDKDLRMANVFNRGRRSGMGQSMQLLFMGTLVLLVGGTRAVAAETEVRTYTVSVDGRRAGQSVLDIHRQDDGQVVVTASANVSVRFLLKTYTYTYQGREVWKAGRLQTLQSTSNDDGKVFQVTAVAQPNGLNIKVNGQERLGRADVWTTRDAQLHDPNRATQPAPLLDADTGRDLNGHLQHFGAAQVTVAGQAVTCTRYRIAGIPSPVDLWFDSANRLVRQEFVEDGHRTV